MDYKIQLPEHPGAAIRNFIVRQAEVFAGTPWAGNGNAEMYFTSSRGREIQFQTFDGQTHTIVADFPEPQNYTGQPGYYPMKPVYTLPAGIENPYSFKPLVYLIVRNHDGTRPPNNDLQNLTFEDYDHPAFIYVSKDFPAARIKELVTGASRQLRQLFVAASHGFIPYGVDFQGIEPNTATPGDQLYYGRWIQQQKQTPLLSLMDENPPLFILSVSEAETQAININTATAQQLTQISGVGPALAARIIAARPFQSLNDLAKVSGIGKNSLAKILQLNKLTV